MICGGYSLNGGKYHDACYTYSGSQWTSAPSFQIKKEFSTLVVPHPCDYSAMGIISTGGNQHIRGEPKLNTMEVLTAGASRWRSDLLPLMPDRLWTHCTVYINATTFMLIGGLNLEPVASTIIKVQM